MGRGALDCPRCRDRDHEADRSLVLGCHELALDLRRSQLRLEIHERALDLDVDDLPRSGQDEVRRARIPWCDRYFQAGTPAGMGRGNDRLRQRHLAGVPQADRRHRVEPPAKLVSAGGRKPASRSQGDIGRTAFSLASLLLADACQTSHFGLR